jgi:phosphatidylinositol glycan class B
MVPMHGIHRRSDFSGITSACEVHPSGCPRTWRGLWLVVALAMSLRFAYAIGSQNTHHPDEVFQYLEPAHRLVFGYGIIPWEYRFGTRSWLIPYFASVPLYFCRFLNIDQPSIYVPLVKCWFCMASIPLVFSGYSIARSLISESAGRVAAIMMAFWYELIYFSPRPFADVIGAYFLFTAMALLVACPGRRKPLLFGFLTAAGCAVRMQYSPLGLCLFFVAVLKFRNAQLGRAVGAAVGVILAVGYLDELTWGKWFISYYNNYLFNSVYGVSEMFGRHEAYWFIDKLLIGSNGILLAASLLGLCYITRLWVLVGSFVTVVGVHSLIPHKEYRFIFASIPMLVTILACVSVLVFDGLLVQRKAALAHWILVGCMGIISIAGFCKWLPGEESIYGPHPLYSHNAMLDVFISLSKEDAVSGVFVEPPGWTATGGYYYLHQDVPIYFSGYGKMISDDGLLGLKKYVTHIVANSSEKGDGHTGFVVIQDFGALQVWKQQDPPIHFTTLPSYTRNILYWGIDDKFSPTVRPMVIDKDLP